MKFLFHMNQFFHLKNYKLPNLDWTFYVNMNQSFANKMQIDNFWLNC